MNNYVLGIVAIIIIAAGAWFLLQAPTAEAPVDEAMIENGDAAPDDPFQTGELTDERDQANGTATGDGTGANTDQGTPSQDTEDPDTGSTETVVTYTGSGFSPSTVEVSVGDTVVWMNDSGGRMWVASAVHPTHERYGGTTLNEHCSGGSSSTFDQCSDGSSYSFTFDKAGEWGYHNHLNASHTGTVIVTQ